MRVESPESPYYYVTKEVYKLVSPASPSVSTSATSHSSSNTTSSPPFTRRTTVCRKRSSRSPRRVRFGEEDAAQIKIIERIPHEYKASLWYTGQELADIQYRDVQENLRFFFFQQQLLAKNGWRSVLAVEASMAAHNLSWRGLEHCQPAYLVGGRNKDTFQTSQDYIQSVLQHAADFLLQTSQRYDVVERGSTSNSHDDPSILGDTTESLADFASSLSQEDSQRASLRGQQDAWMAARGEEMDPAARRLSFYRGPSMISNKEQNYRLLSSCNSDYPSFLFQDDHHRDNTRSLVLLFVLWLMLLARFSLTNEQ